MIRFLFDMGLPRRACDDLRAEGIEAVHLGALGMARLPDSEVIEFAVREGRTIVTLDRDFTQLVAMSGAQVPSVVYIRQNVDRAKTLVLVRKVLAACAAALTAGSLVSITEDQIRVRPLPVDQPTRRT